ncbi:hypothetical protein BZA05DRAFT_416090 [Tricharina praecox]|uniref:uncharacterized protein n=1 Tax=Tricharina praecox TaxID=43433 RepID=UPI002220B107|nr:uncharacterized protein BZA05DRAFT_416090 [Tricharina praecox]KAI5856405.1 hypothetical protein BZA05DRAFT_416090 [Tricharina praecox]
MFFRLAVLLLPWSVSAFPGTLLSRDAEINTSYDYVIVGGGTSGLVSILVIEAGPIFNGEEEFNTILIPGNSTLDILGNANPQLRWGITGQPNAMLNNRTTEVIMPKLVGGGSAVNGMVLDRGSRRDYDEWAEYTGDKGWGWESMLKYFKKVESFTPPSKELQEQYGLEYDPEAHGYSGHVNSSYPPYVYGYFEHFIAAEKALGVPVPRDQANGNAVGSYWTPNTLDPVARTRSYSKTAYYDPAKSRPNLHLLYGDPDPDQRRKGSRNSSAALQQVKAKKEVILAAGGVHSPRLLQLSGIGDGRLLKKFGIPVVVDLPGVGNNYQDHMGASLIYNMTLTPDPTQFASNLTYRAEMAELYFHNRTGPFTLASGGHLTFYPFPIIAPTSYLSHLHNASLEDPAAHLRVDIHPHLVAGFREQRKLLLASFATNETAVNENVIALTSVQKPLSRGFVEIVSSSPWDKPTVDWRSLSNPLDMAVITEGSRFIRRVLARPELAGIVDPNEVIPGAGVQTDEEFAAWVAVDARPTFWHSSCSCAMVKREWGGVVDSKLKIYGVRGLRIVDASVMPMIPAKHLQNTVYAVAERAANLIKRE